MNGIMRHVKEERLVVLLRFIQCFGSFPCQGFGDKDILSPVFIQARNGEPGTRLAVCPVTEIGFSQITGKATAGMSGNVYFESEMIRVLSRCIYRSPMGFSAMDGMITVIFQYLSHRGNLVSMFDACDLTDTVYIPVRQFQHIALPVCRFVFGVCPVRYPVTACIHAGIEAATTRRADTGSISLGKHHTLAGEAFHVRRFVYFIIMCLFLPEREGSILPAHIIYQEENNIRPVLRFGRFSLPGCSQ